MGHTKDTGRQKIAGVTGTDDGLITSVTDDLCMTATSKMARLRRKPARHAAPSRSRVIDIVENLRKVLFPGYFGPVDVTDETLPYYTGAILDTTRDLLENQVIRGFCFDCSTDTCTVLQETCINRARSIVEKFMVRLPHIRRFLVTDVQAAYETDPSAVSADEVIFCYPGLLAITCHRIAHELYRLQVPLIPRIISEYAHGITGIDIHPGAEIEDHFFMDHGTGIVIGETCRVGSHVRLFQGVTLGAAGFSPDKDGKPGKSVERHPILEDNVIVYPGAVLLGRITIGAGSVIAGNVWLTKSVPPNSKIMQKQATRGVSVTGAIGTP